MTLVAMEKGGKENWNENGTNLWKLHSLTIDQKSGEPRKNWNENESRKFAASGGEKKEPRAILTFSIESRTADVQSMTKVFTRLRIYNIKKKISFEIFPSKNLFLFGSEKNDNVLLLRSFNEKSKSKQRDHKICRVIINIIKVHQMCYHYYFCNYTEVRILSYVGQLYKIHF